MAKRTGVETLFFVLFLDCWQELKDAICTNYSMAMHIFCQETRPLWLASFLPVSDEKTKSHRTLLPKVTRHSKGGLEPKSGALSPKAGSNTEFSSSSKNLDEGLAKLFDEIQLQVFSKVPFDDTRTAGYPQKESLKNTEFVSSSNQEEHLAKLFDEILQQVFSNVPYEETRTAGKSVTERDKREGASVAGYSTEPRFLLGSMDRVSTNGHVSEKRNRKSFLFSRDINEQFSTEDNETLQEAVRTDTQNKDVPCVQLLDFLQRNIIIAAASVAGILVVTVLLLLVFDCIHQ